MMRDDTERLTRTGPGTPAGDLLRRYWQPVALAVELPPGAAPVPLRVMAEDLVLFRVERDRLGLLGLHCSHRGCDLSYGRIEGGGLRCLYHGWLYDIAGRCLEQPGEPADSTFKDTIRHTAYPCREIGATIFAYLGPGAPPLLPELHFLMAPADHLFENKVFHACNYLQGNEGNLDPGHLSYLHDFSGAAGDTTSGNEYREFEAIMAADTAPAISVQETRFGLRICSAREAGAKRYVRMTNYLFPNAGIFAGVELRHGPRGYSVHWHVPIDDESHWKFEFFYHPDHPFDKDDLRAKVAAEVTPDYRPMRTQANRYLQDRAEMAATTFAGMGVYFPAQDVFAVESQGPVQDRTAENLATSDIVIARARRMMLNAISGLNGGGDPPFVLREATQNTFNDLLVLTATLDPDVDPFAHCAALAAAGDYHASG